MQKENELLWLIDKLMENKVRSLLSIGLLHGGSEWHIARIYREHGLDIGITGIDISLSSMLQKRIKEISSLWNQSLTFIQASSHLPETWDELGIHDAAWIDGDHSYEGVKQDFEFALTKANKIVTFHDIVDSKYHRKKRCFVSKLWNEIKQSGLRTEELSGDDWAGIGIVYV